MTWQATSSSEGCQVTMDCDRREEGGWTRDSGSTAAWLLYPCLQKLRLGQGDQAVPASLCWLSFPLLTGVTGQASSDGQSSFKHAHIFSNVTLTSLSVSLKTSPLSTLMCLLLASSIISVRLGGRRGWTSPGPFNSRNHRSCIPHHLILSSRAIALFAPGRRRRKPLTEITRRALCAA